MHKLPYSSEFPGLNEPVAVVPQRPTAQQERSYWDFLSFARKLIRLHVLTRVRPPERTCVAAVGLAGQRAPAHLFAKTRLTT